MAMSDAWYMGAVYDAMNNLGYHSSNFYINLKPVAGYSGPIFGPALTTYGRTIREREDFKQLDKRQLLQQNKIEGESAASHFDIYDDDDELVSGRSRKSHQIQTARDVLNTEEDGILAEEK